MLEQSKGVFAAGVAGAPVTKWGLYDTHYTERYLGDPKRDAAAYARADAIDDAAKIVDPLLLVHGMADDNVVLDNSTAFAAQMQAANRPFEMMLYPGQDPRRGARPACLDHDRAVPRPDGEGSRAVKRRWLIGVSALALVAAGGTLYLAPLAAEPNGANDCGGFLPAVPPVRPSAAQVPEPAWAQRGGTVNDASCLSRTAVAGVVAVRSEADVARALAYATRAQPAGIGGGGEAFDGRAGVSRGRGGARHARA